YAHLARPEHSNKQASLKRAFFPHLFSFLQYGLDEELQLQEAGRETDAYSIHASMLRGRLRTLQQASRPAFHHLHSVFYILLFFVLNPHQTIVRIPVPMLQFDRRFFAVVSSVFDSRRRIFFSTIHPLCLHLYIVKKWHAQQPVNTSIIITLVQQ